MSEDEEKEKRQPPPPEIIKCPSCDEEAMKHDKRKGIWRCEECGHEESD